MCNSRESSGRRNRIASADLYPQRNTDQGRVGHAGEAGGIAPPGAHRAYSVPAQRPAPLNTLHLIHSTSTKRQPAYPVPDYRL